MVVILTLAAPVERDFSFADKIFRLEKCNLSDVSFQDVDYSMHTK